MVPVIVALVPFLINYLNKLAEEAKMKDKTLRNIDMPEDAIETSVLMVIDVC